MRRSSLGGETALRATYTLKSANVTLPTVQYITAHDGQVYTLTFTGGTNGVSTTVEKEILASWGFLPVA